ncbi:MAG: TRAP transporter substrate-binding protein DctP [Proteobacteria bacterium]|nr:TRAP transporter substrate-binding protein DctP [Pseudomonadota bacterium]
MTVFTGQQAGAETYNWRMQSVFRTPATIDGLKAFAEKVKENSGGQINIKVYGANELVKIKATREAVQSGAIEMANDAGAYIERVIPEGNIEFGLPFSYRTWEEAWEAWAQYGLDKLIAEAYAEKGLHMITILPAGDYLLMTTKPVEKVEDLKGLKIRAHGMVADIFAAFGASPTNIPGAEQYVALQRGTVDGTVYPVFVLEAYKLKEVIKSVNLPGIIAPPTTNIYMNLELWNKLPQNLKDAITKARDAVQADMQKRYLAEGKEALDNFASKHAGKIITLPDEELKKLRKVAFTEWDKQAAVSPRCKQLIDIMKKFMADKGLSAE